MLYYVYEVDEVADSVAEVVTANAVNDNRRMTLLRCGYRLLQTTLPLGVTL